MLDARISDAPKSSRAVTGSSILAFLFFSFFSFRIREFRMGEYKFMKYARWMSAARSLPNVLSRTWRLTVPTYIISLRLGGCACTHHAFDSETQ